MKWYSIAATDVNFADAPPVVISATVHELDGSPADSNERPVLQHELRRGKDIRNVEGLQVDINRRHVLGDCLAYRYKTKLIFSTEMVGALGIAGVRLSPTLHLVDFLVRDSVSKETRRKYQMIWPLEIGRVLAVEKSQVELYPGTQVVRTVNRWSLRNDLLRTSDLHQVESRQWIVSQSFVDVVEKCHFTGVKLDPLVFEVA